MPVVGVVILPLGAGSVLVVVRSRCRLLVAALFADAVLAKSVRGLI